MKRRKEYLTTLIIFTIFAMPFIGIAQDGAQKSAPQIVTVETAKTVPTKSPKDLLPEKLAGLKAAGDTKIFQAGNLNELAGDRARIYQEYRIVSAASRQYSGSIQAEVYQLDTPYCAYGLFTHEAGNALAVKLKREIGSASAWTPNGFISWKDAFLVRVKDANAVNKTGVLQESLAAEIAKTIGANDKPVELPTLLNSLPKNYVAHSERYFLGADSLNAYFERGREIFSFNGDAEATIAEYQKPDAAAVQVSTEKSKGATKSTAEAVPAAAKPLKLVIVEYHTPQFATEANKQASAYLAALSEDEQNQIVVKRIGNFLVGATNFEDRQFAEQLIDSIEYPYVVKWLQNPAIPTRDPFHEQKLAQVILSSFSLVGLAGLIMMTGGLIIGSIIFMRRRRQSREAFSDAGGMLRLQLDPIENIILGLPPKRSDED
jgi:hypothetical protein